MEDFRDVISVVSTHALFAVEVIQEELSFALHFRYKRVTLLVDLFTLTSYYALKNSA